MKNIYKILWQNTEKKIYSTNEFNIANVWMVVSFVLGIFSANNMGNGYVKKIQFCFKKIRELKKCKCW